MLTFVGRSRWRVGVAHCSFDEASSFPFAMGTGKEPRASKNKSRRVFYSSVHRDDPLFGHSGFNSPSSVFPTGGLPASRHSSPLNLTLMGSRAEHLAAHERLKALEAWVQALLMNPPLTGARAARDFAQGCGCP